jgi:flavin reductase (DIM6/NTAB) family NADH-FMN oxidoreductase RutF
MKLISKQDLQVMERFYRANLINSISGLKPVNLIGTINNQGTTNLAIFSSVMHLGANPALLAFVQRPLTETSHTFKNIIENKFYTINHVNSSMIEKAHFTSAKFMDNISEFEQCALTPVFKNNFIAPYVNESVIQIGMQLVETISIQHNKTTLVIGEIVDIHVNEELIENDGNIDLEKSDSITVAGLETYYRSTRTAKLPYAQVSSLPKFTTNEND